MNRKELEAAEEDLAAAHALFEEAGAAVHTAKTLNWLAHVACMKGDPRRAERFLRDAIRILKPLGDRGTLVETQRQLAEVLLDQGRIDEAERYALQARETVGPEDAELARDDPRSRSGSFARPRGATRRRRGSSARVWRSSSRPISGAGSSASGDCSLSSFVNAAATTRPMRWPAPASPRPRAPRRIA